jgi:type I restriction enzyme S subunit
MTDDLRIASVAELQGEGVLLVEDGNHGEYRPRPDEFVESGVAFIRAADMDSGRVLFDSASKISDTARRRITKGVGAPGDVLLSHKGTVGKVALVPGDAPPFVCSPQTTFWRTLNEQVLDRRYLHAFMRSRSFHLQLGSRAGETDMAPYVSLTAQRAFKVSLPPLAVQRGIASITGALDDKIELTRRMNETLEDLARTIFKSWFVDFDPVRAKAKGSQPVGMDAETAALFPSRFVESELGEIPEGWRAATLGDLMELKRGHDLPAAQRQHGPYPICSSSGISGVHADFRARAPGVVTGRYGTIGQVFYVESDFWPLNTTLYVNDFKGNDERYVYYSLRGVRFENYTDKAAVPGINRNHVHQEQLVIAPRPLQERFRGLCEPMWSKQRVNDAETKVLAELRDMLLPKLISGELRVPQAEVPLAGGDS